MDTEPPSQLTPAERQEWQQIIAAANWLNLLHHCRQCGWEWVASTEEPCRCGSQRVERIACWQFPDD